MYEVFTNGNGKKKSSNPALVSASIKALLDVFVDFGARGLFVREKVDPNSAATLEKDPKVQIKEWIREYKNMYVKGLCNAIVTSKSDQILVMLSDLQCMKNL